MSFNWHGGSSAEAAAPAMDLPAAAEACRRETITSGAEGGSRASGGSSSALLYDCRGRAAELTRLGA
jgi:hypothetical protein